MNAPSNGTMSRPPGKVVQVDLGARTYEVMIGSALLGQTGVLLQQRGLSGPVAIVVDARVAPLYAGKVGESLRAAGFASFVVEVLAGEPSKSLEMLARIHSELAKQKLPRSGTVLALGGGVMGDLGGFAAASYLRGVAFVQIPTTLLAMVDSSVGGKTGVNLPEGKNLVGAFYQPRLVVADLDTLATLPTREFAAGMAEIIKYGAIKDRALFARVAKGVKPEDQDLAAIIETCVAIKARIVEEDEFEEKGLRALLNFGHTIGHGIEKATGYKMYLHGEAISLGMRAAAWLSVWHGSLAEGDAGLLERALVANGLPVHLNEPDDSAALILTDKIQKALGNDKKVASDGRNRWVLLKTLGAATAGHEIAPEEVERVLKLIQTYDTEL